MLQIRIFQDQHFLAFDPRSKNKRIQSGIQYTQFNSFKNRPYSPEVRGCVLKQMRIIMLHIGRGIRLASFLSDSSGVYPGLPKFVSFDLNIPLVLRTWRFKHGEKSFFSLLTSETELYNWRRRCIYLNTVTCRFNCP